MSHRVLFLPGASGAGVFWKPVADRLPPDWSTLLVDLPGFGTIPADPYVNSFDDLVALITASIRDDPVDLVAQSMGGVVAMRIALEQPRAVRSLVLVATSGGVDLSRFDLDEWRSEYRAEFPNALTFVTEPSPSHEDMSDRLAEVRAPTLLLWAHGDRISPPEVGQYLLSKLPNARLEVLDYKGHMFARDHADVVAALIAEHLGTRPNTRRNVS